MRGKDCRWHLFPLRTGITPAYAGKRLHQGRSHLLYQDHPRLCGEKTSCYNNQRIAIGSPPPMRGKVFAGFLPDAVYGITPAYAGKSGHSRWSTRPVQDHPRLCGEKRTKMKLMAIHIGSPPPMRGKVYKNIVCNLDHRITPAYAGKSRCHKKEARGSRDHPRLCGEKVTSSISPLVLKGSPPPMRGKED